MSMTLVVLAAGIGSRYGGLKQIEAVGPHGAIVIEYSVFDAIRAGFDRVVCVIRRDIEKDFRSLIAARFETRIDVEYVFQEMDDLPPGFSAGDRRKPWGTGHAVLAARSAVPALFAVINADDFYGRRSFAALGTFLRGVDPQATDYSMVGFTLRNTLSEHGTVARGLCDIDSQGWLHSVVECTKIEKDGRGARLADDADARRLTGDETVSMNMWGFTPRLFAQLQKAFPTFLRQCGHDPKAEFFLPTVVDALIRANEARVNVLQTPEHWFGVTYPQDKAVVAAGIGELVRQGVYPEKLWA